MLDTNVANILGNLFAEMGYHITFLMHSCSFLPRLADAGKSALFCVILNKAIRSHITFWSFQSRLFQLWARKQILKLINSDWQLFVGWNLSISGFLLQFLFISLVANISIRKAQRQIATGKVKFMFYTSINCSLKIPVKYIGFPKYNPLKGGIIQKLMSCYFTSLIVPIEFIQGCFFF